MAKAKEFFTVDGVDYPVPGKIELTLGELFEIEKVIGPVDMGEASIGRTMVLLYVSMRAKRPETTIEEIAAMGAFDVRWRKEEPAPRPPVEKGQKKKGQKKTS